MTAAGFPKGLFIVGLISLLSGCAQTGPKPRLGVSDSAGDARKVHQRDPAGEGRAVWISSGYFSRQKETAVSEIRETLDRFAGIGVNNLFCFSALPGQHQMDWDFLEVLLQQAHARGMKVHPCYCAGHLYPAWKDQIIQQNPQWLIKNIKENRPSLNLALPEVREFIIGKVSEALRYDIDGIHLDYIRFQTGQGFSYDDATCQAFKRLYGSDPLELRWHNCGSVIWCEWMRWNASHVTALVRGVRHAIEESGKQILLSAAVFPDYESAKLLVGQDWQQWAREGLVDILCPMLYTSNHEVFQKYAQRAVEVAAGKCLVYPGIAIVTSHAENTAEDVIRQIRISRGVGADGVVFFGVQKLKGEFIDLLKTEVFNEDRGAAGRSY